MKAKALSEEDLSVIRSKLMYNPLSGKIYWRTKRKLKEAGTIQKENGYRRIGILGTKLLAQRIAWMLYYDTILSPDECIDHVNRNKLDNSIKNLRVCTKSQNNKNVKGREGTSKYKGVHYSHRLGKWVASSKLEGKSVHIGCFLDEDQAAKAYNDFCTFNYGVFANTNILEEV